VVTGRGRERHPHAGGAIERAACEGRGIYPESYTGRGFRENGGGGKGGRKRTSQ